MKHIKVIAFDADDTLWVNEPYFREAEEKFSNLLEDFLPHHSVQKELFKTEMDNLSLYGYGVKSFMLSMVETIGRITNNTADIKLVNKAVNLGRELLNKPVEILDGVEKVLAQLNGGYRLVMATKGDLLDQERKLIKSGLEKHFHHIEIMSDKKVSDYAKLLKHLDCKPEHFLMIGNSVKSDVIPVLELGGFAIHVPYHTTWAYEKVDIKIDDPKFFEAETIEHVIDFLYIVILKINPMKIDILSFFLLALLVGCKKEKETSQAKTNYLDVGYIEVMDDELNQLLDPTSKLEILSEGHELDRRSSLAGRQQNATLL